MRPVEHDGYGGTVRRHRAAGGGGRAWGGQGGGGRKALAGEEDGVGQEAGQLAQVLRTALAQVGEGFGGHARGHRGQRHQLRVRGGLTAQRDQRLTRDDQRGHALGPGVPATEQAQHDEGGAGRQRGHLVRGDPGRVGGQVAGAGSGRGEEFGIGGGNQENGEHSPILPCSATANSRSTHRRSTG